MRVSERLPAADEERGARENVTLFAENTKVPVERSRVELESLLRKHGATEFTSGYSEANRMAVVQFAFKRRLIRFVVGIPSPTDKECAVRNGKKLTPLQAEANAAQLERQRWRALLLCVKAKLEIVKAGIVNFETEFLAYTVLANKKTVAEELLPRIDIAIAGGTMPMLALPGPTQ